MGRLLDCLPALDGGLNARLRPLDVTDVAWLVHAGDDPDIVRWNGVPSPFTADAATDFVTLRQRGWAEDERATFVVADSDDRPGGYLSLRLGWARGIGEVGYWLLPTHRRRGLMTDAIRSVRDWAFDALGLTRLQAGIQPGNAASEAVVLRLGFAREGLLRSWDTLHGVVHDEWMFSLLPTDSQS